MEIKVKKTIEVTVKTLKVKAGARYWEDATVNGIEDSEGTLMPFIDGDYWCPEIDIDTGIIANWPNGTTAKVHYKVCDDGEYTLIDEAGNEVMKTEGYVPNCLCPKKNGYGDYIIMDIDGNGKIENWKPSFHDWNEE